MNPASHLPSPGCPLVLTLVDGSEVLGIRPGYIERRDGNPGYYTADGEPINNVIKWRHA